MEEHLSLKDRILLVLHSLCAVRPGEAKRLDEIANFIRKDKSEVNEALIEYENQGYTKSFTGPQGEKYYYLTAAGILRVCSVFT